ncbi:MAG TPA: hypothetical protein VJQ43_03180, partial [Thermoplasmata archaeon]|nr:hypothetical protein [Thermoplasmata archaeon]
MVERRVKFGVDRRRTAIVAVLVVGIVLGAGPYVATHAPSAGGTRAGVGPSSRAGDLAATLTAAPSAPAAAHPSATPTLSAAGETPSMVSLSWTSSGNGG